MDMESEMIKFASYYAGIAVAVLITGYIQVSDVFILLGSTFGFKDITVKYKVCSLTQSYSEAPRTTVLFWVWGVGTPQRMGGF